jgi:hypothetical protein
LLASRGERIGELDWLGDVGELGVETWRFLAEDVVMCLECCLWEFLDRWRVGVSSLASRRGGILYLELRWLTLQQGLGIFTFYSSMYILFSIYIHHCCCCPFFPFFPPLTSFFLTSISNAAAASASFLFSSSAKSFRSAGVKCCISAISPTLTRM